MHSLHSIKSTETIIKGHKNVSHKTSRDVEMVLCVSQTHLCLHGKNNWQEIVRNKERYHSMQQPMQVDILCLQDTLATLSPSLHLSNINRNSVNNQFAVIGQCLLSGGAAMAWTQTCMGHPRITGLDLLDLAWVLIVL